MRIPPALQRPPLEICEARARDRAEDRIAKYDRDFYALFSADARHMVEPGDQQSPRAIAKIIFQDLKAGRFRVASSAFLMRRNPAHSNDQTDLGAAYRSPAPIRFSSAS
jgi:hypothetical protein